MFKFILLTVFILKPIYIDSPDIISEPADLRDYYYEVQGCLVAKEDYNKNPYKYYYSTFGCEE